MASFRLQPDVDHRKVVLDRGDLALDDAALEARILAAKAFVEERGEIVAGRKCLSGHKVWYLSSFDVVSGRRVGSRGLWK
jgi:hypothetical protein